MWFLLVPFLFIVYDFMKLPIDVLYFQNYIRPLVGIRNTFIDIFMYKGKYNVYDFQGLWKIKANFEFIKQNYEENVSNVKKYYFHKLDKWFKINKKYYYYKVSDFPEIQKIIDEIPCVDKKTAVFAVMDAPMTIPAHKAESNMQLRYHMTIKSGRDCKLITHNGTHIHFPGDEILFDHSRYHKVTKRGYYRRVTLILDVNRLFDK
jgi:hypothetical protein